MRINPLVTPSVLKSYQANKPGLDRNIPESRRDEVMLSDEALNFSKALADARSELEFRTTEEKARIADIKNAINKGEYKVDSNMIAERIVDDLIT